MTGWIDYSDHLRESSKKMNEHNDCTVKAWSNVFDCPYQNAHTWLKAHGRRNRIGLYEKEIRRALDACKKALVKYGPYSTDNRITVSAFCKKHPKGRFYVCSNGHAFCIKDGIVYDHHHGPRRQIKFAARVYLEGEL